MFYLLFRSLYDRQSMIVHLLDRGIQAVFHYVPLNRSPMAIRYGGEPAECPVAESVSSRLLRLPFYYNLTADDQTRVIEAILAWRP